MSGVDWPGVLLAALAAGPLFVLFVLGAKRLAVANRWVSWLLRESAEDADFRLWAADLRGDLWELAESLGEDTARDVLP